MICLVGIDLWLTVLECYQGLVLIEEYIMSPFELFMMAILDVGYPGRFIDLDLIVDVLDSHMRHFNKCNSYFIQQYQSKNLFVIFKLIFCFSLLLKCPAINQTTMSQLRKYPPKLFHSIKIQDAFKIATQTKFANLILTSHAQMDVVFNPFFNLFKQTGQQQFYGHLAKFNPVHDLLTKTNQQPCKLVFNAADTYISPICYHEKQLTHNVVPTWNYTAAEFRGKISKIPEQELLDLLTKQVQIFEESVGSQWRLSDSSPEYVEKLLKGIFGVKVEVDYWKAHMKLSQNKPPHQVKNIRKWSQKRHNQDTNILTWMDEFK